MYSNYNQGFPWIKFTVLSVPLIIIMFYYAPTLKWKLLFSVCVPVGVWLALAGKSLPSVSGKIMSGGRRR